MTNPNRILMSEMKTQYQAIQHKKERMTREKYLEEILRRELYEDYIRNKCRVDRTEETTNKKSEYYEEFCKFELPSDDEFQRLLSKRFPLYSSSVLPITFWNPEGDPRKMFKKQGTITKSVHEQNVQFG